MKPEKQYYTPEQPVNDTPPVPPNPVQQPVQSQNPYRQTYEQQPAQQLPTEPQKGGRRLMLVVALVIALLLTIGVVAFYLFSNGEDNLDTSSNQETATLPINETEPNEDAIKTEDEPVEFTLSLEIKGRDVSRKNDINSMYQKLEEYYNEYGFYPSEEFSEDLLLGISPEYLVDIDGDKVNQQVFTTTAPPVRPNNDKPSGSDYTYIAYDCDSTEPSPSNGCQKYTIFTWLEGDSESYIKTNLN